MQGNVKQENYPYFYQMKKSNKETGADGEDLAISYLTDKGYEIIEKNYRYKNGEIDLIVSKEKLLAFVEVKFRSSSYFGMPEETVSKKQKKLIISAAENYILENNWEFDIRFDIIAILKENQSVDIQHFEDAFF